MNGITTEYIYRHSVTDCSLHTMTDESGTHIDHTLHINNKSDIDTFYLYLADTYLEMFKIMFDYGLQYLNVDGRQLWLITKN